MRTFITSRPELLIHLSFIKIKGEYQDIVLYKIPILIIEHDIYIYLEYELARIRDDYNIILPEDLQLVSDWPGGDIIQALTRIAIPLFIFATTVCRFIND